jgi:hypothetical protein
MVGPTVEGRSSAVIEAMTASAVNEVADYTRYEVLTQLDSVLVNPTGFYESQIADQTISPYLHRIHDSGVVYGPWLEGVGSRNYPVTRFKGYHTFRIVKNRMAQKTKAIIEAHFARVGGLL